MSENYHKIMRFAIGDPADPCAAQHNEVLETFAKSDRLQASARAALATKLDELANAEERERHWRAAVRRKDCAAGEAAREAYLLQISLTEQIKLLQAVIGAGPYRYLTWQGAIHAIAVKGIENA